MEERYESFDSWYNEIEGFSLRSERFLASLAIYAKDPTWNNLKRVTAWLEAAYLAGVQSSGKPAEPCSE